MKVFSNKTEETGKQGKTKLANIANSEGTGSLFVAGGLFIWCKYRTECDSRCKYKTECDSRQKLPNSLFINKFIFRLCTSWTIDMATGSEIIIAFTRFSEDKWM